MPQVSDTDTLDADSDGDHDAQDDVEGIEVGTTQTARFRFR